MKPLIFLSISPLWMLEPKVVNVEHIAHSLSQKHDKVRKRLMFAQTTGQLNELFRQKVVSKVGCARAYWQKNRSGAAVKLSEK
jgi:hypothetical protein